MSGANGQDRKKILLVDDSPSTLMMERMVLQREPFDLVTANSGEEAVEKAMAERPDLVLLDVVMPGINGFEVCRRLREHEDTRGVPIIMVTTRGESQNMESGFAAGCTDYVTKPINSLELMTKVKTHLKG